MDTDRTVDLASNNFTSLSCIHNSLFFFHETLACGSCGNQNLNLTTVLVKNMHAINYRSDFVHAC